MSHIPEMGFLRLGQIIGDQTTTPPTPPIIPVSSTTWWEGIKKGLYPEPTKISKNISAWEVGGILDLVARLKIRHDYGQIKTGFDTNTFVIVQTCENGRHNTVSLVPEQSFDLRDKLGEALTFWGRIE